MNDNLKQIQQVLPKEMHSYIDLCAPASEKAVSTVTKSIALDEDSEAIIYYMAKKLDIRAAGSKVLTTPGIQPRDAEVVQLELQGLMKQLQNQYPLNHAKKVA